MSHLKLVASVPSPDTTPYAEAFEQLDTGLCIIGSDGSVLANNQEFCRLLDLPSDWASPKAAKRAIPASEELVTGWLARVASEGGVAETVALSDNLTLHVAGKALPSGGVSLTLSEAIDKSLPLADIANQATTQQALQESEANFHALFEEAGVGIGLVDFEGVFLDANPALLRLFGHERAEFIGQDLYTLTAPEDRDRARETYCELIDESRTVNRLEKRYLRKNGERFRASVTSSVVRDSDGKFLFSVAIIEDITERIETEQALHESDARLRAVIDNASEVILLKGLDGRFQFVGKSFETVYGVPADEVIGKTSHDVVPKEFADFVTAQDRRVIETGEAIQEEAIAPHADGTGHTMLVSKFPVRDNAGNIVGVGSINTDIIDQIADRRALRESHARLRAVLDNAGPIVILKGLDGRFQFVGKGFEALWGVPVDEVIGRVVHDIVPAEFADVYAEQDQRVIETGESIQEEVTTTFVDGKEHTVLVTKFPVRSDAGKIVGVGSVSTDITDQVADRRALRDSEARFRTLLDHLPNLISLKDGEGKFLLANKACERAFGVAVADMVGRTIWDLLPGRDWHDSDASDAQLLCGEKAVVDEEVSVDFPGHGRRILQRTKFPIFDGDGQPAGIGTISTDVTERLQAERLQRESEARFRTLLDHSPVTITLKDAEGKFLLASKACEYTLGVKVTDMIGRTNQDLWPDHDWHEADVREAELLSGEKAIFDDEFSIDVPGRGRRILQRTKFPIFDGEGQPAGIGTISTDVTERLQAEQLLRESEAKFRALVDNLPADLTLKDLDQNVLFVNGRVAERFGIDAEEFVGKKFEEVVPDLHNTEFLHAQQAAIDSGEAMESEYRTIFGDGSEHDLHTVFFPVNSGDGEHINVGIMTFDITERKRTEEMLIQAQKMEAVGQLTGGIAHDFNNLLSVIVGNLELVTDHLADQIQADAPVFDYIRSAFSAAERGAFLIQHLLAFARKQVLRPEEIDLGRLIYETNELMSVSLGEKIAVELSTDRNLWRCTVDRVQLQNAILNLAINARDAMSSGGRLTISVENTHLDSDRAADLELEAGDYVGVSVSDTGAGIDDEALEHVFEPFFTTKDVGEGSGLGLSMVYGFARQSGGSVEIETGSGEGTTVRLYFPAIVPDIPTEMGAEIQDERTKPVATILLVEDNAAFREITRQILENLNYHVVDFGTAEEALEVVGGKTQFDLLLSDIGLPGRMNGHDLAEYAASARPGLKVVLMSAHAEKQVSGGIVDRNVAAFLRKPHRKAVLAQTLRRVLGLDS
ncbi:MAG: PAS domain S-box protein [Alphaproteobacteria bacterium]|nr:PAS domain S-box protein [Alphaproteobacteria bacterium]